MIKSPNYETLHIINKSPSNSSLYQDCFSNLLTGDALLFIESAVYATLDQSFKTFADLADSETPLFVLNNDLLARGINDEACTGFKVIEDSEFVGLCCKYKKTVSWF